MFFKNTSNSDDMQVTPYQLFIPFWEIGYEILFRRLVKSRSANEAVARGRRSSCVLQEDRSHWGQLPGHSCFLKAHL